MALHPLPLPGRRAPERRPRWRAPLLIVLAVLALHALTLARLPPARGDVRPRHERRALQVRQVVVPTPPPSPPPRALPPAPSPRPDRRPVASPSAPAVAAASPAAPAPPSEAVAPVAASAAADAGEALPVYATRLPPAARLDYELRRGPMRGSGGLDWRPDGERYAAALEGRAFGVPFLQWSSEGAIDAAGLAPERYVDRRRGRGAQAANVQRDRGRVTFSGPSTEYPVVPGLQDRLSWMIQVSAIVEAAPARFGPGARIEMFVVGARGDGDVWTFDVEAVEPLDLPGGRVQAALRLHRAPRRPYDTQVDVWLDPARHHLPVKVRLAVPQSGDATEFLLTDAPVR